MYTIIEVAGCRTTMIKAINAKESEGWHPIGGVVMTRDEDGFTVYAQAMVKEPEPAWIQAGRLDTPICTCSVVSDSVHADCPVHGEGWEN